MSVLIGPHSTRRQVAYLAVHGWHQVPDKLAMCLWVSLHVGSHDLGMVP